jgi:hypothetical protein
LASAFKQALKEEFADLRAAKVLRKQAWTAVVALAAIFAVVYFAVWLCSSPPDEQDSAQKTKTGADRHADMLKLMQAAIERLNELQKKSPTDKTAADSLRAAADRELNQVNDLAATLQSEAKAASADADSAKKNHTKAATAGKPTDAVDAAAQAATKEADAASAAAAEAAAKKADAEKAHQAAVQKADIATPKSTAHVFKIWDLDTGKFVAGGNKSGLHIGALRTIEVDLEGFPSDLTPDEDLVIWLEDTAGKLPVPIPLSHSPISGCATGSKPDATRPKRLAVADAKVVKSGKYVVKAGVSKGAVAAKDTSQPLGEATTIIFNGAATVAIAESQDGVSNPVKGTSATDTTGTKTNAESTTKNIENTSPKVGMSKKDTENSDTGKSKTDGTTNSDSGENKSHSGSTKTDAGNAEPEADKPDPGGAKGKSGSGMPKTGSRRIKPALEAAKQGRESRTSASNVSSFSHHDPQQTVRQASFPVPCDGTAANAPEPEPESAGRASQSSGTGAPVPTNHDMPPAPIVNGPIIPMGCAPQDMGSTCPGNVAGPAAELLASDSGAVQSPTNGQLSAAGAAKGRAQTPKAPDAASAVVCPRIARIWQDGIASPPITGSQKQTILGSTFAVTLEDVEAGDLVTFIMQSPIPGSLLMQSSPPTQLSGLTRNNFGQSIATIESATPSLPPDEYLLRAQVIRGRDVIDCENPVFVELQRPRVLCRVGTAGPLENPPCQAQLNSAASGESNQDQTRRESRFQTGSDRTTCCADSERVIQPSPATPACDPKSAQEFIIASAASFSRPGFDRGFSRYDIDGAIIYENMRFRLCDDGSYEVRYCVSTPETVQLRIQLLLQLVEDDGTQRWHTLTLRPKTIPLIFDPTPKAQVNVDVREVSVRGTAPFLAKRGAQIVDIRRRGSARFGSLPPTKDVSDPTRQAPPTDGN